MEETNKYLGPCKQAIPAYPVNKRDTVGDEDRHQRLFLTPNHEAWFVWVHTHIKTYTQSIYKKIVLSTYLAFQRLWLRQPNISCDQNA